MDKWTDERREGPGPRFCTSSGTLYRGKPANRGPVLTRFEGSLLRRRDARHIPVCEPRTAQASTGRGSGRTTPAHG
ncbi:hypothetical protein GCM10027174_11460 [Salinifilum aidingensis]